MPIIETEIWKKNPDKPGTVIFDSLRPAEEVFKELKAHLKAEGRLPDDYFSFSDYRWPDGAMFPRDADIKCNVDFGGSEGIYLDISVKYEKEEQAYNAASGKTETKTSTVTTGFATGKTLGDSIEDLDKMHLAASSVTAAFYGSKPEILKRYARIETGEEEPPYPQPPHEKPAAAAGRGENEVPQEPAGGDKAAQAGKASVLGRLDAGKRKAAENGAAQIYNVEITETLQKTVSVKAKSPDEAESKVREAYRREEYVLDAGDHTGTDFAVTGKAQEHSHKRGGGAI